MTFTTKYLTLPASVIAALLVLTGHGLLAIALLVGVVVGVVVWPRIR